jgi:hypothetical protein
LTEPDATIPYNPSDEAPVVGISTGVVLLAASCRPPVDVPQRSGYARTRGSPNAA